jgi:hypothetical protein
MAYNHYFARPAARPAAGKAAAPAEKK